jgi:Predicted S-adenosylmethionine-dependent methyltransferase involved in bacterial cell division
MGHLVESNTKKAKFLSNTSKLLGIDIKIHNERFENLKKFKNDNKFVLTSRAVYSLNKIIKISLLFFSQDQSVSSIRAKNGNKK